MSAGKTTQQKTLTRAHRILISVVIAGAAVIAAIGFAGSYTAVRELAEKKGFGDFAYFFPIGIDAGIVVLLALDLLLTWLRIPFPLLRQTAWLLTVATVAFNAAAAWPDALGVGMHAVIPLLFVVAVEAARHAVGRIADITADKHMEGVRLTRWLLSPVPTFLLWRRMKLWELRSYDAVIKLEQERLVYQARLRSRFGRGWRRKAPVESLMPLRLARYGVPLVKTAPAGLAAAGIEAPIEALADPAPAELASADNHQHTPGASEDTAELAGRRGEETSPAPVGLSPRETHERVVGTADLADAFRTYLALHGSHPNSRQFALHLADIGITDPETGGPLPEGTLRPALQELRREHPAAPKAMDVVDPEPKPEPEQWQAAGTSQPTYSSVADHGSANSAASAPTGPLPEPVATASATGGQPAHHPVSSATGQGAAVQADAASTARPSTIPPARVPDTTGQPERWETDAQDTGEATARKPQPQQQEVDPEAQRTELVVQWLIEAEAVGKTLSGAEAARRLGVAARTGQRAVSAAKEVKAARERQQGRSHLRSVTHRT
ncbi:DUF2637 domain-containing protein (plasmid) [Streptomyces sp. P9-2B-2]|uniref:DUF2637 domain-containing protein n=1 Tax=Streptomyces sp. P9-2B-2 TaxID=3057114 RepID=UPI0025B2B83F|nr:DUF2637 domain-containing protein [Streptomyces sp. P9-2B-2]WJY43201.1 DUF2637 domain-containing protein [Streptomyces sp. P9-2B-2]